MLGESSHCEIRPGAPADAPALSEVFRNSWSNAYLGIIPHLHLDSMIRQRTPDWWGATIKSGGELLVLQVAGVIAGYATLGAARVRGDYEGEIYELYVAPTYQGLGFGERLFEACRYHLDGRQLCRTRSCGHWPTTRARPTSTGGGVGVQSAWASSASVAPS